jgi:hypothetical protein
VIKTENGVVKFEGEVTQKEFDYIFEIGLNTLLISGVLKPVKSTSTLHEESTNIQ